MVVAQVRLVGASSLASIAIGCAAGVFVTRRGGAEFRGLVETVVAIGQTFPPVAVLAIAVPALGFGAFPAFIALSIYGLLPIVENTVAGLEQVPSRSEEHPSELQSLMRTSYAVFCLKKNKIIHN